jgi:hypothetical protein
MNYRKHYDLLIERARVREHNGYVEYHHVIPRCLGGTDDKHNLVALTPEEHYVAHQLLVKIYPGNHALVKAAAMMVPDRPSNKLYGWIRKKLATAMSVAQTGTGNSQYGFFWIHNKQLKVSKKVPGNYTLTDGWEMGRIINFDKKKKRSADEYKIDRNIEARKMAHDLYQSFINSDYQSVTAFAKSVKTSQPRLTILWKKYVPEYNQNKKHGKSFKGR